MLSEEALTDQLCGQIIKMIDDMQTYQLKPENMKKVLSAVQSHAMNKIIDVVYQQGVQDGMNKTNTEEKSVSEIMDSVEMPNVAFDNPSVNETMSSVEMPNVAFEEEPKEEAVSGPGAPKLIDPIVASASMMGGSAAAATSAGLAGTQEEHAKSAMSMDGTNTVESTLEEAPLTTFEEPENKNVGTLIEEPMDRALPENVTAPRTIDDIIANGTLQELVDYESGVYADYTGDPNAPFEGKDNEAINNFISWYEKHGKPSIDTKIKCDNFRVGALGKEALTRYEVSLGNQNAIDVMNNRLNENEYTEEDERFIRQLVESLKYTGGEYPPTLGMISEHDRELMVEAKRRYQENQIKL